MAGSVCDSTQVAGQQLYETTFMRKIQRARYSSLLTPDFLALSLSASEENNIDEEQNELWAVFLPKSPCGCSVGAGISLHPGTSGPFLLPQLSPEGIFFSRSYPQREFSSSAVIPRGSFLPPCSSTPPGLVKRARLCFACAVDLAHNHRCFVFQSIKRIMQKNGLEVAGSVCDSNRADNQH